MAHNATELITDEQHLAETQSAWLPPFAACIIETV